MDGIFKLYDEKKSFSHKDLENFYHEFYKQFIKHEKDQWYTWNLKQTFLESFFKPLEGNSITQTHNIAQGTVSCVKIKNPNKISEVIGDTDHLVFYCWHNLETMI